MHKGIKEQLEIELKKYNLGIFEPKEESIEKQIQSSLEKMVNSIAKQIILEGLNISIFWVNSDEVNAVVTKIDSEYCIGIFKGLTTSLLDHIETYYNNGQCNFSGIEYPSKRLEFSIIKEDKGAMKLGNYIFSMALFYFVMHEFGHILCGHCDTEKVLSLLFENDNDKKGGYEAQAKEYIADFYGVANSYSMLTASCLEYIGDIGRLSSLYVTAIHSILWIFSFNKKSIDQCDCSRLTHPHPYVRISYFYNLLVNELTHTLEIYKNHKKIEIFDKEAAKKIIDAAYEDFFNIISETEIEFDWNAIFDDCCEHEEEKIMDKLEVVVDKYREVAYVDMVR